MKKRRVVLLSILLGLLIIQSIEVMALQRSSHIPNYYYHKEHYDYLEPNIDLTFKNGVDSTRHESGAETYATHPFAGTSVYATFYWVEYNTDHTIKASGMSNKSDGAAGMSAVEADSLAYTNKYYYYVVSNHTASYSGQISSFSGLATPAP